MGSEVGEVSRGTGIGWFGTSSLLDARGERIIAPKKTENNFRLLDSAKSGSCDLHDYTLPPQYACATYKSGAISPAELCNKSDMRDPHRFLQVFGISRRYFDPLPLLRHP